MAWTDLSLPGDHVVVPVVLVPADEGQLLPLSDVVGPQQIIKDKINTKYISAGVVNEGRLLKISLGKRLDSIRLKLTSRKVN